MECDGDCYAYASFEVRGPYSVTYHNQRPIFCGVLGGVFLRMDTKRHLFKQDITTCSNFLAFMGSIIDCNWGYLYDHLRRERIFTFILNQMIEYRQHFDIRIKYC